MHPFRVQAAAELNRFAFAYSGRPAPVALSSHGEVWPRSPFHRADGDENSGRALMGFAKAQRLTRSDAGAARRLAAVVWFATAALLACLAGCAVGPQERRVEARGSLDVRTARRTEVHVVRDAWGFTVDPVQPSEASLAADIAGAAPGSEVLGVPAFLALRLVALANGAVMAATMDAAQGGYAAGERKVLLAAEGKPLDATVADAVVEWTKSASGGEVTRGSDRPVSPAGQGSSRGDDPARMPTTKADGREVRVQVRTLFQGLQRRAPVGMASGSDLIESSPPLALVVAVQVLATAEIEEGGRPREAFVGGVTVHYESPSRMMGTWSAERAKLLREELAAARAEVLALVRQRIVAPPREQ